jgi:phosphoadenosine phosphosulfate reductase
MAMDEGEIAAANELLGHAPPQEVLRWAVKRFHPRLLMATAFGAEGCCIIHMLSEIEKGVKLINLETGYQFPETLALRETIRERYGMTVEYIRPETTVSAYEKANGGPLYEVNPDQCCNDRKVKPLKAAMERIDPLAWISAIRKDQTLNRAANAGVVQWDAKFNVVKVNPLLNWTKGQVWKYILDNNVPYNELHDRGFPSIGCWPCTRAVRPGEDDRAGRWAGQAKKECGLHVIDEKEGSGI